MKRNGYPLQWPSDWRRTKFRETPNFVAVFVSDRDAIVRRLQRRGRDAIITSNLPLNTKGLPYASPVDDPGIAVYWTEIAPSGSRAERVIACDRWRKVGDNLRALAKSIEALDGLARWGASQVVERTMGAFAALPAGSSTASEHASVPLGWRIILAGGSGSADEWPPLANDELIALARHRHRELMKVAHPDKQNGSVAGARDLNLALACAIEELS